MESEASISPLQKWLEDIGFKSEIYETMKILEDQGAAVPEDVLALSDSDIKDIKQLLLVPKNKIITAVSKHHRQQSKESVSPLQKWLEDIGLKSKIYETMKTLEDQGAAVPEDVLALSDSDIKDIKQLLLVPKNKIITAVNKHRRKEELHLGW